MVVGEILHNTVRLRVPGNPRRPPGDKLSYHCTSKRWHRSCNCTGGRGSKRKAWRRCTYMTVAHYWYFVNNRREITSPCQTQFNTPRPVDWHPKIHENDGTNQCWRYDYFQLRNRKVAISTEVPYADMWRINISFEPCTCETRYIYCLIELRRVFWCFPRLSWQKTFSLCSRSLYQCDICLQRLFNQRGRRK